jgi:hypothetical protein
MYTSIFVASASVINPLVAIFGIAKYRRYVLAKLTCGLCGECQSNQVASSNDMPLTTIVAHKRNHP